MFKAKTRKRRPGLEHYFPHGKLDESDRGALNIALEINREKEIVEINFGTDVSWIGLEAAGATQLGMALLAAARTLNEGKPKN